MISPTLEPLLWTVTASIRNHPLDSERNCRLVAAMVDVMCQGERAAVAKAKDELAASHRMQRLWREACFDQMTKEQIDRARKSVNNKLKTRKVK